MKIQALIPDYKCKQSFDKIPQNTENTLSKMLPFILEILNTSFTNFLELNPHLIILKVLSLTTVLIRFEEKSLQKYFIKQFNLKIKNQTSFDHETFISLIHWFDTIEYIYDFLTSELTQMMNPPQISRSFDWINSSNDAHSKIVRLLSQKLGFVPNLWILSFFLNFDQRFFQEEILRKAPQSFLWGFPLPQLFLRPDSNPNFLLRSNLFSISENCLLSSTHLLHEARLRLSVVSSQTERKNLKENLNNKRKEVKSVLIKILSTAIFLMVKTDPIKAKEMVMTKKSDFSPELFKRLLRILDHQSKNQPENMKGSKSKPLKHIEIENRQNLISKNKFNNQFKSKERLSVYRGKMSFHEMRQHFKKDQEKTGQAGWRGLPKEKFATRSPIQRKVDICEEKFHSQFGVKKIQKEMKYEITSEFKLDDKKNQ
jgi:hypothetical protein